MMCDQVCHTLLYVTYEFMTGLSRYAAHTGLHGCWKPTLLKRILRYVMCLSSRIQSLFQPLHQVAQNTLEPNVLRLGFKLRPAPIRTSALAPALHAAVPSSARSAGQPRSIGGASLMAAASKATQGDLTTAARLDWSGSPLLVDIGLNLADSSFDKV